MLTLEVEQDFSRILWRCLTAVAVVVHQDDLLEQVSRCVIDHAVYGAQDHRQSFIHKDEHHRDLWQVVRIRQLFTSAHTHTHLFTWSSEATRQHSAQERDI